MISQIIFSLLLQQAEAQLEDILSYQDQRYSECGNLLSTCQPTISTCANIVCGQCTDLGQTAINYCCSQASPVECFIDGAGGNSNYITTAAPDPNLAACSVALDAITICESETPGFSNLANSDEASCLCYDDTTSWDPLAFDGPWSSCIAWASTADATDYAGLLSNAGMCASVGNILHAPASAVAPSTTAGAANTANGAKATVTSAEATATSSAAKATSSSADSNLEMNIKGIFEVQVSSYGWSTFGFGNKRILSSYLALSWVWYCDTVGNRAQGPLLLVEHRDPNC